MLLEKANEKATGRWKLENEWKSRDDKSTRDRDSR